MMPNFSGEDVFREMKKRRKLKKIPVILLTARASQEDRVYGLELGADDYMAKPILAEELILRVGNLLSRIAFAAEASKRLMIENTLADAQEMNGLSRIENVSDDSVAIEFTWNQAEITGGDWVGITHHSKTNRLYIFLGDVTGHGLTAALVTVALAGAVKASLNLVEEKGASMGIKDSLYAIANAANEVLLDASVKMDRHMTMNLTCLDLQTGRFYLANAGHNEVIHVNKKSIDHLLVPGDPMGFEKDLTLGYQEVDMVPGDRLFFFTDGLIENLGPDKKSLSRRHIYNILTEEDSPGKVKESILSSCRDIWKGSPAEDDYSFLILKWHGPVADKKTVA